MFSIHSKNNLVLVTFILSSANIFYLDHSKRVSFGEDLMHLQKVLTLTSLRIPPTLTWANTLCFMSMTLKIDQLQCKIPKNACKSASCQLIPTKPSVIILFFKLRLLEVRNLTTTPNIDFNHTFLWLYSTD